MGKKEKVAEVTINVDELQSDAKAVAKRKGSSVTKILAVNDLGSGTFGHLKERYLRICGSMGVEVEPNLAWGLIPVDRYHKICDVFGLDSEKYLVSTVKEKEVEEESVIQNADALKTELQTMREAIQDMGRIAAQSMMYLQKICEILE